MEIDAKLSIVGKPVCSVVFEGVPSRNSRGTWRKQASITAEWRFEAREKALKLRGLKWDEGFFAQCEPLIKNRALIIATVYIRGEGVSDVHNPDIKPMLDGFTDAGVYVDDEWSWNPLVLFAWGGISRTGKNKVRLDVYELDSYVINGVSQVLPAGRYKV